VARKRSPRGEVRALVEEDFMGKGSLWVRAAAAAASLALSAVAQPGFAEDKPKPDEMVNNPPYENWAEFPVGTSITQKETVKLNDGTTVAIDTTSKLVKKDKESVVVETTMGEAGGAAQTGMAAGSKTTETFPA